MISLAAFAFVVSLAAEEFAFESPSFWDKTYSVPSYYSAYRIEVETRDVSSLERAAAPCKLREAYEKDVLAAGVCRLPEARAQAVIAALRSGGRLIHYWRAQAHPPPLAEIRYKYERLLAEREILGRQGAIPGIIGLVDDGLNLEARILTAHQFASLVRLEIVIAVPAAVEGDRVNIVMPANDFPKERLLEIELGKHPWRRGRYAACEQIPRFTVEFTAIPGSREVERIRRELWKLGQDYAHPKCAPSGDENVFAIVSRRSLNVLQSELSSIRGFRAFSYSKGTRPVHEIRDDERIRILSAELRSAEELLKKAPHVRALAAGEIWGIRSSADELKTLRGSTLVVARISLPRQEP